MSGLTLLHPWFLLLALFVPGLLLLRRRRGSPAITFAPAAFLRGDPAGKDARSPPISWCVRLLPLPSILQSIGLLLAIVALARPVRREPLPLETEGIDLLLCLDVSSSMGAKDLDRQRTRLDVARTAAIQFIRARPADRIGLLCFARFPDLRCPLTLDHDSLERIVAMVATVDSDGPEDATGIGAAVARAAQLLRASAAKSKVAILLTDGEENVATAHAPAEIAPVHAAQLCEQLGVRVYTIAAGASNVGPGGERIALDTTQVRWLAERTGGRFFEARDANAVAAVYASIDELEKSTLATPRFRIVERFLPCLVAAVALLLAGRLLGASVLGALP